MRTFWRDGLWVLGGVICLALALFLALRPEADPAQEGPAFLTDLDRELFYERQVRPALERFDLANTQAATRAARRISREIERYAEGIPAFVEDISGWGTRFGVLKRMSQDWWGEPENATRVRDYVVEKFERNLFSQAQLAKLLQDSLAQFRDDLRANQNRLHAGVQADWALLHKVEAPLAMESIVGQVNFQLMDLSTAMASDSLKSGIIIFLCDLALGEIAEILVRSLVLRVAAYLATSAAATTVAGGGATGTGLVVGGTGGSAGGPVGTLLGIAAGIVVGLIVDWWMTKDFEEKLTEQCSAMLEDIKVQILVGWDESPGLKQSIDAVVLELKQAEARSLMSVVMEVMP